uniref:Proteasome assembly chaperone 4 n=1 Tax=Trichuris muris TaxID=70415 RepID=A0A5S6Q5B7_TRIMR
MNDESCACRTSFETCQFNDQEYRFLLCSYDESCYVWIGTSGNYGDLALALKRPDDDVCLSTKIIDKSGSPVCEAMAAKLAKKMGKQVFVGFDTEVESEEVLRFINQKIFEMNLQIEQSRSKNGAV